MGLLPSKGWVSIRQFYLRRVLRIFPPQHHTCIRERHHVARPLASRQVLLPLGLVTLLFTFAHKNAQFRETLRYTIQGVALIPIFIAAVRCPEWLVFRPLNWRWIRHLGVLSFTFYQVHLPFVELFAREFDRMTVAGGAISFAATLAFSQLMHQFVEEPCAKLRKRLSQSAKAGAVCLDPWKHQREGGRAPTRRESPSE